MERVYENWKDCKGYEGLYQVSDKGRIWSVKRQAYLKPVDNGKGYLRVMLITKNGKKKMELIHRLVCLAFLPNPENYPEVNHRDEDSKNNYLENLEWCSHKYNINYGTRNDRAAEGHKKKIGQYNLQGELVKIWASGTDAEREGGFNRAHISSCCHKKRDTHGGFIWGFIDGD